MYGSAGACSVINLFTSAQAWARASGSVSSFAALMASLTSGTLSSGQFELPVGMMLSPLNVGSSIVCASAKSCAQPTDGQTLTSESGTLQNLVNIVSRVTRRSLVLKPISLSCCSVICAIDLSGSALSPTIRTVSDPSYLPEALPAFLKYSDARARSPSGLAIQSSSAVQPASALDSSKPAIPGGM